MVSHTYGLTCWLNQHTAHTHTSTPTNAQTTTFRSKNEKQLNGGNSSLIGESRASGVEKEFMGITIVTSRCHILFIIYLCLCSCVLFPCPAQIFSSNLVCWLVSFDSPKYADQFSCCCYDTDCNASILIEKPVCLLFSPDEFTLAGKRKKFVTARGWFLTSCRVGDNPQTTNTK